MVGDHWPGPLADLLDESIGDEAVERLRSSVEARRRAGRKPPVRRRTLALALAGVLIVASALLAAFLTGDGRPARPRPLRLRDGGALRALAVAPSEERPRHVELRDGSSIDLAPGTVLTPVTNDGRRVALRLERGRATFDVELAAGRRWSIDAGLATVEVVGTLFTVSRTSDEVEVSVARGRVRVSGDAVEGGERLLALGDTLEIRPPEPHPGGALGAAGASTAPTSDGGVAIEADADTDGPRADWRLSADRGDWSDAYRALGASGLQREARRADTVAELLVLADVARRSGHAAEAVGPLERAVADFPDDRRAPVAAFTLGVVEEEQLGRPHRAVRAFRRCVELGPPAALREDAWGRLAEAHARAGQYPAARRAAQEYLRRFPEGIRAERFRQWTDPR